MFVTLGIPLGAAAIALGALVFSFALWRDHRSLTAKALARSLGSALDARVNALEGRFEDLRREANKLAAEVGDMLEDASKKAHRGSMRERRAREREERLETEKEQALAATPAPAPPSWDDIKRTRMRQMAGI